MVQDWLDYIIEGLPSMVSTMHLHITSTEISIDGFTSFLEVMFAVNIAIGLWRGFIPTLTRQVYLKGIIKELENDIIDLNSLAIGKVGDTPPLKVKYEKDQEKQAEHLAKIIRYGRIHGIITAFVIVMILWLMGLMDDPATFKVPIWIVYVVTIVIVLPFALTVTRAANCIAKQLLNTWKDIIQLNYSMEKAFYSYVQSSSTNN